MKTNRSIEESDKCFGCLMLPTVDAIKSLKDKDKIYITMLVVSEIPICYNVKKLLSLRKQVTLSMIPTITNLRTTVSFYIYFWSVTR